MRTSDGTIVSLFRLSLAYAHACDHVREPETFPRPGPEELEVAQLQAVRFDDQYMIEQIARMRQEWERVENTPTPKHPPASKEAVRQSTETYIPSHGRP